MGQALVSARETKHTCQRTARPPAVHVLHLQIQQLLQTQLLQTQMEIARMAKAIVDMGQALVSARETKRACQRTARPPAVHVLHLQIQQLLQTQLLQTQIEIARMAKRIVDIGQALVSARETKRTCQRIARHLAINAAESCTDTTLERPWCMPLCMGC